MNQARHPGWLAWTSVVPLAFLAVFLGYPVTRLVVTVIPDLTVAGRALWSGELAQVTALAAMQAALSTVLALAVGLPVANLVSRYRFGGRPVLLALVTVPFVLPTVVVALAIRSLVGDGVPQGLLLVVLAHAYVNLAVVVRVVGASWSRIDGSLEVVARTLGASRLRAFRDVTWPLLRPAIASSAAVVFVFCFTSLGIVIVLGGAEVRTLELRILRQTSVLLDFPGAAVSAVLQFVLVTVILVAGLALGRRAGAVRPRPAPLRVPTGVGRVVVATAAALTAVVILAPVAALALRSFRVDGSWALDWWASVTSVDAGTTRIGSPAAAVLTSLGYAAMTAAVAAVVGGLAALAVIGPRRNRIVALLAMVPLGISAATLGLGTLLAFGRPPIDLRAVGLLVPIAHALVAVPLVVAVVSPALRTTDPRVATVAAALGARPTRAFWTAYGPVLRVVVVASAGLAAAVSLGEFGAASFLTRASDPTVPVQIVRLLGRPGEQSVGVAAALAVILVAVTMLLLLCVDRLGRSWRSGAAAP